MKIKLLLLLIMLIMVVGCAELNEYAQKKQELPTVQNLKESETNPAVAQNELEEEDAKEVVVEPTLNEECSVSEECTDGKKCIDGTCLTIQQLYDTDCAKKCNFNTVVISSSMGDSYTLSRGQGSYTGAGSVEWKLVSGPDYCPGDEVIVPIELIKKSTGEIISKEILTINPGQSTQTITHPDIKSVSFSLTVDSVNEVCS